MARGSFHPVLPVCASTGVGCAELLDLVVSGFPAPSTHPSPEVFTPSGAAADPLTCDPGGPLVAEVVKTTSDPYVGRVSLVRVFSGTLDADSPVHVSGHFSSFFGAGSGHDDHDDDERVGSLAYPFGQQQAPAKRVVAGDIATDRPADPGRDRRHPLRGRRAPRAPSVDAAAAAPSRSRSRPTTKSDEDKLSTALGRLAAEDPSVRIVNDPETRQLVVWAMGEAHADAALERLRDRFGVSVETGRPRRTPA